jgi:2-oxoglutarate ferredoxin oxidoreductase subunit gamma
VIIRFAGFGGQGVVLSSVIIGQAAAFDGKHALQNQAYGSESRGGQCSGDVIISDDEICELEPVSQDVLAVMTQPAYDRYISLLKSGGTLIYDQDLVVSDPKAEPRGIARYGLNPTGVAVKKFGKKIVANMVVLGYMNALLNLVSDNALVRAVSKSVPAGTQDLNIAALREGAAIARVQGVAPDYHPMPDGAERHGTAL